MTLQLAFLHMLLQPVRQFLDQPQPATHPACAAAQPAGYLWLSQAMHIVQSLHKVGVLKLRPLPRALEVVHHDQGIDFAVLPHNAIHHVVAQTRHSPQPLVPVDDHISPFSIC